MDCFILAKSGNYEDIELHYSQITSFAIGSWLVMRFAIHGRSKDVLCERERFAEIRRDIDESLVPQSVRDWYDGTDDEQDTDSEQESDCEWS